MVPLKHRPLLRSSVLVWQLYKAALEVLHWAISSSTANATKTDSIHATIVSIDVFNLCIAQVLKHKCPLPCADAQFLMPAV